MDKTFGHAAAQNASGAGDDGYFSLNTELFVHI
jgi:hypothetical protein